MTTACEVVRTPVDIATRDGAADAYLARPDDEGPYPGVLLYANALGIRPHVKSVADRIAAAGYVVLMPNLFYRHGRTPVFELPEFVDFDRQSELVDRVGPVLESLTAELAMRDAEAYLEWLAGLTQVAAGPVAITGYCLGARLALLTAGTYPERVAAAAGFHGGFLATDAADSPHLVAPRVTAELYFGHADQDPSLPAEEIDRLGKALAAAGVRHRAEVYEGAAHGYTLADTSSYHAASDERHWSALFALLDRTF
ncbi:dienelactone hydrolase family protein [Streptomyces sp. NBC_01264]|uniref:dienelactone hydrolase family protein n=1 Tax=Streptomyces sp. NBC_01264 TaxID=2903804 RepID=UPI00225725B4|nr:dienelactone hydrolase family protein [Streptomyces sp. NBC_01264]MCX4782168.1 dienelactone hydrolase family protein [Streptomyces sp. NBC_01264]